MTLYLRTAQCWDAFKQFKSVTAAEVRLTDKEAQGSNEKPEEEQFDESPPFPQQQSEEGLNPLPAVDLSGLNQYRRTVAEAS